MDVSLIEWLTVWFLLLKSLIGDGWWWLLKASFLVIYIVLMLALIHDEWLPINMPNT